MLISHSSRALKSSARIERREKNAIYAHLDEQGRYRVKLNFDQEESERGYGYLWLCMAKPYSGEGLGWHTPLIDGTEVATAYGNGDIDLPYISHAMHDSIGVLVVTLGIPEAIIGAFLLIVRLAISAWGTLAAILGTGTAALAAG